jgi:hypothetical protein
MSESAGIGSKPDPLQMIFYIENFSYLALNGEAFGVAQIFANDGGGARQTRTQIFVLTPTMCPLRARELKFWINLGHYCT